MNVSAPADAEFVRLLESEDPERYARLQKNIRADLPNSSMPEDQALTNFMLGFPTGQHRFAVVAGGAAPEPINRIESVRHSRRTRKAGRPRGSKDHSSVVRRTRIYVSDAERQKAYRTRKSVTHATPII